MIRTILFIAAIVAVALGVGWLADRPGSLTLQWLGYTVETSVFVAMIALVAIVLALLWLWSALAYLLTRPGAIGAWRRDRKRKQGYDALSRGMIAVGAGDREGAARNASIARRALPNEPLTSLLRAQASQMNGERMKARRIFEGMLSSTDTEVLGLRGLYLEARRENDADAARQFVERAVRKDPDLGWSINALFEMQCRDGDWAGALKTLATARQHNHIDAPAATRRRAVLLTAQAMEKQDSAPDQALAHAKEAHNLAPTFVPPAAIAGRLLGAKGETQRATKLLARTWRQNPHPDLAAAYTYARQGDAAADRMRRVRRLAAILPQHPESAIALALAAIDARAWRDAREALAPLTAGRPTARVCVMMARIEREEHGDKGREREWLSRAVRAPRDPVWIADGYISDRWLPVSPITGALDAFEWRAPVEALTHFVDDEPRREREPVSETPLLGPARIDDARASGDAEIAERMAQSSGPVDDRGPNASAGDGKLIAINPKPAAPKDEKVETANPNRNARPMAIAKPAPVEPAPSVPPKPSGQSMFSRAPDDPGIDPPDTDEVVTPLARYRQPIR